MEKEAYTDNQSSHARGVVQCTRCREKEGTNRRKLTELTEVNPNHPRVRPRSHPQIPRAAKPDKGKTHVGDVHRTLQYE